MADINGINSGERFNYEVEIKQVTPKPVEAILAKVDGFISELKKYLRIIIYCSLMLVFIPVYVLGMIGLKTKLACETLKRKFRFYVKHGRLDPMPHCSEVCDVGIVSTDNRIDFMTHRGSTYLWGTCFSMPWEIVNTILGQKKIQLISDEQLAYVILNTVFAHSVSWDERRQMYKLSMEQFDTIDTYPGYCYHALYVLVSPVGKKFELIIQMKDKEEYSSECAEGQRPTFDLAKLHVQVCLSYFAPGLSHNHVHFVLPSAVAVLSQKVLNRKGTLHKLLYPHFRFTECINYQAMRTQKATSNNNTVLDHLVFLWHAFPVTKVEFGSGVAKKCASHYIEKGKQKCDGKENDKSAPPEMYENGPCEGGSSEKLTSKEDRKHKLFPPDFVTDQKLKQIPYLNFLAQYYSVIHEFVESMESFIDEKEWKILSNKITKYVPGFEDVKMVDAIATFIHQAAVIHFCDHQSYLKYFAFKYGCMSIQVPFLPLQEFDEWDKFAFKYNLDVSEVRNDPLVLMKRMDVLHTRAFLKIFVDFVPSECLDLLLVNTKYNFTERRANMAVETFRDHLKELDKELKEQSATIPIKSNHGEKRAKGMQLIALNEMVRTICY